MARPAVVRRHRRHRAAFGFGFAPAPGWCWASANGGKIQREDAIRSYFPAALEGATVTIDAMGTQANIAEAIRARGADYMLASKTISRSWPNPSRIFGPVSSPIRRRNAHGFFESVEKAMARGNAPLLRLRSVKLPVETGNAGLKSFAVIESERATGDKTTHEHGCTSAACADARGWRHGARPLSVENRCIGA